jgi:transcriptional regulator with PAS, ATPase and Fis domain
MQQVRSIAPTDSSVLITGESGTGKELVANAIHLLSSRNEKAFVAVNCGALPETLLESELFGHIKGAFTGATSSRQGLIETSDGGTLLLDEIGDASLSVQVKLLRVLENGTMRRVGDTKEKKVNVRLLAATNKDLQKEIENDRFRQDLFFRINVIPIHISPLRERTEDIPLLANSFLKKHSMKLKKRVKEIEPDVLQILMNYSWPGNIRELENTIEYSTAMCDSDKLQFDHLPITFQKNKIYLKANDNQILSLPELEKRHILHVLEYVNWNQRKACELMKISKVTLYRRLKEYGIKPPKKQAP